jgi:hypothetical protein
MQYSRVIPLMKDNHFIPVLDIPDFQEYTGEKVLIEAGRKAGFSYHLILTGIGVARLFETIEDLLINLWTPKSEWTFVFAENGIMLFFSSGEDAIEFRFRLN